MGQGSRPQAGLIAAVVAGLACAAAPAAADPIVRLPSPGRGLVRQQIDGPGFIAVSAEISGIGVITGDDMTSLPVYGAIARDTPELGLARIGMFSAHDRWPVAGIVRIDLAEATRVAAADFDDDPFATVDRFVDDAAVWWRNKSWAEVITGRQKVPFSRFRQLDITRVQAGAVPFVVDRVAPDRRWGATLHGDLGAMSYALGGFEDVDVLEHRTGEPVPGGDPSADGRSLLAFHFEWTPRAPIGDDLLATPTTDPWWGTVKVAAGFGLLYRFRQGGRNRVDVAVSGQAQWRQLSAVAEILVGSDTGAVEGGIAGQLGALITDRATVYGRGEYDQAAHRWSTGAGAAFFVTSDRRTKVGAYGWVRRHTENGPRLDGAIVQLQACL